MLSKSVGMILRIKGAMMKSIRMLAIFLCCIAVSAQDKDAYQAEGESAGARTSLLDPSRFSINHSLSFGAMSGSGFNSLQSQSLYSTMMQYRFAAPVTLNLNFGLPIHSTFSQSQNLTGSNIQSLDYFKSIPFEMSLNWKPTGNTNLQFTIAKYSWGDYSSYYGLHRYPWDPLSRF